MRRWRERVGGGAQGVSREKVKGRERQRERERDLEEKEAKN